MRFDPALIIFVRRQISKCLMRPDIIVHIMPHFKLPSSPSIVPEEHGLGKGIYAYHKPKPSAVNHLAIHRISNIIMKTKYEGEPDGV